MSLVDYSTGGARDVYKAILHYTSPYNGKFGISAVWDVNAKSADDIDVQVTVNSQTVLATIFNGHYDMNLKEISLKQGDVITFVVGPNKNAADTGTTNYRIKMYRAF